MSDSPALGAGLSVRAGCSARLGLCRERAPPSPDRLLSPLTQLAHSFSGLGGFRNGDTPRRCLDLSALSTDASPCGPRPDQSVSPSSFPPESPPPSLPPRATPDKDTAKSVRHRLKKFQSILPMLLCSSPKQGSVSPVVAAPSSPLDSSHNKENDCSGLLVSSVEVDAELEGEMGGLGSPISSGPPSPPPAALPAPPPLLQDGFSEFMETDESVTNVHMTSSMALLLSDPLMTQDMDLSTLSVCSRGGAAGGGKRLFRSPSMPERLDKAVLRRAQPPSSSSAVSASTRARTPPRSKRYRNDSSPIPEREREEDEEGWVEESRSGDACKRRCLLQKTVSLCEEELGREGAHCQLTGDFSKVCALPIVSGRHQDLKYITAETLSAVLAGQFSSLVESCVLVDCRYPYEYEGGHIKGALNLSTPEGAAHHFLHTPMAPQCPNRRLILVLHCEYSSERAPRAARFLRREDRRVNEYPALHYPELYILKGGYKDFFPQYKELCVPQSYCPMNSSDHREELLRCRSHSRSWAGQRRRHEHISRLMKL